MYVFFFFKQKTANELRMVLLGSELFISDRWALLRELGAETVEWSCPSFTKRSPPTT